MFKEIKVLMIDDDKDDFILIREMLAEIKYHTYTINWIDNYQEGLAKVISNEYDVYLVDYNLGVNSGLDLVLEAKRLGCVSPFIIHTGQNDIGIDAKVMAAGAVDFLVKGAFSAAVLDRSLRYAVSNFRQLKENIRLNADLEKRVSDRTIILEEAIKELNIAKDEVAVSLKKEKELSELKSRFVSMASHEFRTPLATILSSLSLIESYSANNNREMQAKHVVRIKRTIMNLTDILNDVLSISKLEDGGFVSCIENINVKLLLSDIVKDFSQILKKGQSIVHNHSGSDVSFTDKKFLRQIIVNLISNAVKFSLEEGIVELSSYISTSRIEIRIKDHGIGISKEDKIHLFEPFFRGSNATNIEGTGLGLSIVLKYVEMLNGSIEFESELDKGTQFSINLPNHLNYEQENIIN